MYIDKVMRQQKFDHLRIPKGTCNVKWKAVSPLKKKQLLCYKGLSSAYSINTNSDGDERDHGNLTTRRKSAPYSTQIIAAW